MSTTRKPSGFHRTFHRFMKCWETIEHMAVPGYANLVRQRCTICKDTRVQELPPQH
jgi:hypothetical protein